ncbi:MAG: tRNA (guanosine(46)-N7)-methyltransferase TrmB [Candidatus Cloacimonetes bacterium]|nr:tRNA (guanosine(46)-N7)-methyltransferase TrmB [Candidatus Cloacimonadota bacterium]
MEKILIEKRDFFKINMDSDNQLDIKNIFGNDNPVHLEIGSGRGEFLIQKALNFPDVNFLGVDIKEKRIKTMLRKLDLEKHANVKLLRVLVDENIKKWIKANSLEKIYILHPDPWPKRKHHKHRLIQESFIDALSKVLVLNGILEIATDHEEYTNWIIKLFKDRCNFISHFKDGFVRTPQESHIETYFETKKRNEGFEPFFMKYEKIGEK